MKQSIFTSGGKQTKKLVDSIIEARPVDVTITEVESMRLIDYFLIF